MLTNLGKAVNFTFCGGVQVLALSKRVISKPIIEQLRSYINPEISFPRDTATTGTKTMATFHSLVMKDSEKLQLLSQ
jgi:hypothetical protein